MPACLLGINFSRAYQTVQRKSEPHFLPTVASFTVNSSGTPHQLSADLKIWKNRAEMSRPILSRTHAAQWIQRMLRARTSNNIKLPTCFFLSPIIIYLAMYANKRCCTRPLHITPPPPVLLCCVRRTTNHDAYCSIPPCVFRGALFNMCMKIFSHFDNHSSTAPTTGLVNEIRNWAEEKKSSCRERWTVPFVHGNVEGLGISCHLCNLPRKVVVVRQSKSTQLLRRAHGHQGTDVLGTPRDEDLSDYVETRPSQLEQSYITWNRHKT